MRGTSTLGRFSAGDALRGLSALGVLGLHATIDSLTGSIPFTGEIVPALRETYGAIGVVAVVGGQWLNVFFVLSGYLISRPFVRAYVRDEPRPDIGRYARNRVLRIVPAFWVAVLATLIAFGLIGSPVWVVPVTLLFGQALISGQPFVTHIAQGWTLGTEVTFYVLVPLVAVWLGRRRGGTPTGRGVRLLAISAAMLAGAVAWRAMAPTGVSTWVLVFPAVAGAFAPGLALAALEAAWPHRLGGERIRRLAGPAVIAGIALFVAVAAVENPVFEWRWVTSWIGAGLIVGGALMREWSGAPPWRLLKNRVTDWLGACSYSIYVLHYGVAIWVTERVAVTNHPKETLVIVVPLTLIATLVLAAASWRFVEQPFLRMRRRWAKPAPA